MSQRRFVLILAAVFAACMIMLLAQPANATYFFLKEGSERCFVEDLTEETLILITYSCPELNLDQRIKRAPDLARINPALPPKFKQNLHKHPIGIVLTVKDPQDTEIYRNVLDRERGSISLTSSPTLAGEHKICFQTNTSHWMKSAEQIKLSVDIETGADATNYEEIATKEELDALETAIRKLNDQTKAIKKEQKYMKAREARFRQTSESTNARTMWLSIFQVTVLICTGIWQIYSLRHFFKAKKLV